MLRMANLGVKSPIVLMFAVTIVGCGPTDEAQPEREEILGAVHFPTSCAAEVQDDFDRSMALVHSFAWEQALEAFGTVLESDSTCAMAYWGLAATHAKIAWGPAYFEHEPGLRAIRRAVELGGSTDREQRFIEVMSLLYEGADSVDYQTGLRDHVAAMEQLHDDLPEDQEAALFYAVALLSTVDPADTTYTVQRTAGAIANTIFTEQPNHPGAPHYLIHAYDYEPLAAEALPAARRYARIAPAAPHARHMPSHIYSRLGLWEETIASNRSALEVAGDSPMAAAHSLDYLVYAHLQRGEVELARQVLDQLRQLGAENPQGYDVAGHVVDAEARFALELSDWSAMAAMERDPALLDDPRFEAIVRYTRSVGSARSGDADAARREAEHLPALRTELAAKGEPYVAANVDIWKHVADAWISHAEGEHELALEQMQEAVGLDEATTYVGSFEFGPDAMVHAQEELGDLLLRLGRPAEALRAYERSLESSPNRQRALDGMARAAGE